MLPAVLQIDAVRVEMNVQSDFRRWSFLTENLFVSCHFDRHESCHFSKTNLDLEIRLAMNLINTGREMWFIQNYFRFRVAHWKCKKINCRQVRQPRPSWELSGKLFSSFSLLPCFVLISKPDVFCCQQFFRLFSLLLTGIAWNFYRFSMDRKSVSWKIYKFYRLWFCSHVFNLQGSEAMLEKFT